MRITSHVRPAARRVPEADHRRAALIETLQKLDAFRTTMPRLSLDEILSARHEGHRY